MIIRKRLWRSKIVLQCTLGSFISELRCWTLLSTCPLVIVFKIVDDCDDNRAVISVGRSQQLSSPPIVPRTPWQQYCGIETFSAGHCIGSERQQLSLITWQCLSNWLTLWFSWCDIAQIWLSKKDDKEYHRCNLWIYVPQGKNPIRICISSSHFQVWFMCLKQMTLQNIKVWCAWEHNEIYEGERHLF